MNERQILQRLAALTARMDAIEAAVDQISSETGTGPAPDAEEVKAPSVPRRAKEKAK